MPYVFEKSETGMLVIISLTAVSGLCQLATLRLAPLRSLLSSILYQAVFATNPSN